MSDRINIEEILKKHLKGNPEDSFLKIWQLNQMLFDPQPFSNRVKVAIKEIVEAAIDKCANTLDPTLTDEIDKESILQVKQLIDYE